MSSTDNRRYRRMKKKEEETIKKKKQQEEMELVIPTPDDVQNYIDNKVLELKLKDNGM